MRYTAMIVTVMFLLAGHFANECSAQGRTGSALAADYKASAAFAEVRLRKAELDAELESGLSEYTAEHPKVKEAKAGLMLLQKEMDRLANAPASSVERMSAALGKLMVKKVEAESDLLRLLENLQPAHPDAKRARRKVEIYESAIKEVLGR